MNNYLKIILNRWSWTNRDSTKEFTCMGRGKPQNPQSEYPVFRPRYKLGTFLYKAEYLFLHKPDRPRLS